MVNGLSNGQVTDDVMWPHRCCEAVRSAILATAWLLVEYNYTVHLDSWNRPRVKLPIVIFDIRSGLSGKLKSARVSKNYKWQLLSSLPRGVAQSVACAIIGLDHDWITATHCIAACPTPIFKG